MPPKSPGQWEGRLTAVESSCEMMRSTSTGKQVSSILLGSALLLGCESRVEHAGYRSGSPAHKVSVRNRTMATMSRHSCSMRPCTSGLTLSNANVAGTLQDEDWAAGCQHTSRPDLR